MSLSVTPVDQSVQVKVTLATPDHAAAVRIDMGDGTVLAVTPVQETLCPAPSSAVSVTPETHTYRAPGPYLVRAVATLYRCVFLHGPDSPFKLPNMGVAPSLVEAAVTYQQR